MPPQGMTREKIRNIFGPPISEPRLNESPIDETVTITGDLSTPEVLGPEPVGQATPVTKPGVVPELDPFDAAKRTKELYDPDTRAQDAMNKLLMEFPIRQKPSFARRLGAGLTYLHDPKQAAIIRDRPNLEAREDWEALIKPTGEAAQTERLANVNLRTMANQIVSSEESERRLQRQIARDRVLQEQGNERIAQAERRIKQGDARLEIQREVAKGGQVRVNQTTGEAFMTYRDGSTKPLKVLNELPLEDRLAIQQEYALERIEATGQNRVDTRNAQTATITDPNDPTGNRTILVERDPNTGEWVPAKLRGSTTTPEPRIRTSQLERDRAINTRAQRLKTQNSIYAPFIEMRNGRFVRVRPPSTIGTAIGRAPNQTLYDQIGRDIYGGDWPKYREGATAPANTPPAAQVPGVPREGDADKVIIRGPQGQLRKYPKGQALPQGWTLNQ